MIQEKTRVQNSLATVPLTHIAQTCLSSLLQDKYKAVFLITGGSDNYTTEQNYTQKNMHLLPRKITDILGGRNIFTAEIKFRYICR